MQTLDVMVYHTSYPARIPETLSGHLGSFPTGIGTKSEAVIATSDGTECRYTMIVVEWMGGKEEDLSHQREIRLVCDKL